MTEIEQKALVLLNKVQDEQGYVQGSRLYRRGRNVFSEALCRAIEQHEATKQELSDFRQEVSNAIWQPDLTEDAYKKLHRFIIPAPKPDPLVDVMKDLSWDEETAAEEWANDLRAALEARGLEIREKNDD